MTDDIATHLRTLNRAIRSCRRASVRAQIADTLNTVRALSAAGFLVESVTVAGVTYQFGPPEKPSAATPLEAWKAKRNARQA